MKAKKPRRAVFINTLSCLFIFIFSFGTFGIIWMLKTWPNLSFNELVYQMSVPITGTGGGEILDFILKVLVPAVIVTALVVLGAHLIRSPGRQRGLVSGVLILTTICLTMSVLSGMNMLDAQGYLDGQQTVSTFIADSYADPDTVKLTFPEKKRNLIYIYLESMEVTYSDEANGGAFADNYIPELTELAQQNEDFSGNDSRLNGAMSTYNTTWTIAGMFAQTSGLPLSYSALTSQQGSSGRQFSDLSFYPGLTNLGDILQANGYHNVVMFGSDKAFAARDLYFSQHGDYDLMDYYYAIDQGWIPSNYFVWWGYEDSKLIANAKTVLLELAGQNEPFNFTMLTVDTHFEDGYFCDQCEDQWGVQYADTISCSSRQIAAFVQWIQQQDFYQDTTIIISGDHPTMDADFCDNVDKNYNRRVYTCYINAAAQPEDPDRTRQYTTLDAFPTTLAALGVQIEGDRLGLGTNLFSGEKTLAEIYGIERINREFHDRSELIEAMMN
jgi:phosphoglycerol transferase